MVAVVESKQLKVFPQPADYGKAVEVVDRMFELKEFGGNILVIKPTAYNHDDFGRSSEGVYYSVLGEVFNSLVETPREYDPRKTFDIVLDLSDMKDCNTTLESMVALLLKRAGIEGIGFALVNPPDRLKKNLEMFSVGNEIPMAEDVGEAVSLIGQERELSLVGPLACGLTHAVSEMVKTGKETLANEREKASRDRSPAPKMTQVSWEQGVLIVNIVHPNIGESWDNKFSRKFKTEIDSAFDEAVTRGSDLVINCADAEIIGESGMAYLIDLKKRSDRAATKMTVLGPDGLVIDKIDTYHIRRFLNVVEA